MLGPPQLLSSCVPMILALPHPVRSQDPGQRRVLDRAARQRRINRQLEALENDNFQDDPHAGLPQLGKRLPQFDDDADTGKAGGGEEGRVSLAQDRTRTWAVGRAMTGSSSGSAGTGSCHSFLQQMEETERTGAELPEPLQL